MTVEISNCFLINIAMLKIFQAAKNSGATVILDVGGVEAPIPKELIGYVDILSPNETELARLTGMPTDSFQQITRAAIRCHEMVSLRSSILVV